MRLIDADKLIESICNTADLGGWIGDTLRNIKRLAVRYINSAPSIDIVRCKECVYCVDAGAQRALVCDNSYIDMDIHPDDFCSYGERKVSEKPTGSEKPNNCEDFFREPTAEERKAVADYIDSISVPTGVNVFDLMDEQTERKE